MEAVCSPKRLNSARLHTDIPEYLNYYYLIELQMGFTLWQWYYSKTTLKQNTAHNATQTMKDTLHTMNTTHKKE
jgi:hypothetical protein